MGIDVGLVMGSTSDWAIMQHAASTLEALEVTFEKRVVSAHRTPDLMSEYGRTAEQRGLKVIIAGAGGAAHLPGMLASKALIPIVGVPIPATSLQGMDALLSIVQMPKGIPVATMAIGKPGAINAAVMAALIVGLQRPEVLERLRAWRLARTEEALASELP